MQADNDDPPLDVEVCKLGCFGLAHELGPGKGATCRFGGNSAGGLLTS